MRPSNGSRVGSMSRRSLASRLITLSGQRPGRPGVDPDFELGLSATLESAAPSNSESAESS